MYKFLPTDPVSVTITYLVIALLIVNVIFLGFIISKQVANITPSSETSSVIPEIKHEQESK